MKIKELKNKPEAELERMLKEEREHLRNLKFDLASKKLKKVREVREVKKTIARVMTLLKEKQGSGVRVVGGSKKDEVNKVNGFDKLTTSKS